MSRKPDHEFTIGFFESVLKRDPAYTDVIEILGGLYTQHGRINDGLKMDRRLVRLQPTNATARYNLACSLALVRKFPAALDELSKAIELGYTDFDWMQKDSDLDELRKDPSFIRLLESIRGKTRKI